MAFFKQEAVTINFSFKDFFSVWDSIEGGKIVTGKIFIRNILCERYIIHYTVLRGFLIIQLSMVSKITWRIQIV